MDSFSPCCNGSTFYQTPNIDRLAREGVRFTDAYYEGGIRVPLIIKWPGVGRPGRVVAEPVTSSDLYPTCLAAAGLPPRPNQHLDGITLHPLLQGAASLGREAIF